MAYKIIRLENESNASGSFLFSKIKTVDAFTNVRFSSINRCDSRRVLDASGWFLYTLSQRHEFCRSNRRFHPHQTRALSWITGDARNDKLSRCSYFLPWIFTFLLRTTSSILRKSISSAQLPLTTPFEWTFWKTPPLPAWWKHKQTWKKDLLAHKSLAVKPALPRVRLLHASGD